MQKINDEIYNAARAEQDKGNYEKAFKLYSEGVEQGDVRCDYGVALFYNYGYFVKKDEAKAAEIFASAFSSIRELAEQNEPISCCIIGYCYFNGFYVSEDKKVAIEWLKKSASLGYALAQNIIAQRYYNGSDVEEDKAEAVKWYRKAAEQGLAEAQYNLGACYNNGDGVKIDKEEAVKWYKKAAEQGVSEAQCNLGFCFFNGDGVKEDKAEAVTWYKKAAEQGYAEAQYNLGNCYYFSNGVKEGKAEAVKWYRNAAEQGYADAQYNLGNCYYKGEGVKEDKAEALKWFRKAAEQGVPEAQFYIGVYYDLAYGLTEDKAEAVKWYKKAAEQGFAEAQYNLANCYNNGWGIKEDKIEAVKWYIKAAEQGIPEAQYNLGSHYEEGEGVKENKTEAVKWYRKAAEQGYPNAQCNLGNCYNNGRGVKEDKVEAVKWYRRAAGQGDASAQYNLGNCYDQGCGVKEDKTEAMKWWRKAAEQGETSAQFNLGNGYVNGWGIKKDEVEAVKWYRMAAEQGHSGAQCNLGLCYEKGWGLAEDKCEAIKWYRKAAEQGLAEGQLNLGYCYHYCYGVEKNVDEALKWYIKSAEQGYKLALYNCGIVYLEEKKDYAKVKEFFEKALSQGYTPANYGFAELYKNGNGVPQDGKKAISFYRKVLDDKDSSWLFENVYEHSAQMYDENYPFCKGIYKDNFKAKEYYEKAIENGADCKSDLKTLETLMHIDDSEANRMGEFVKEIAQKNIPLTSLYSVVAERLKQEFGAVWDRLQSGTKECLITGCISYVALISTGEENYKNMDFSSAILPMVKACEIELGRIFFDKFLEYLQKNNIPPTEFDPEMQKFVVEDKVNNKPEEYNSDEKYIYYRVEKSEGSGLFNYVSPDKTGVFTLGGIDKYAGISKGPMPEPIMQTAKFTFGKNGAEVERKPAYGKTKIVITVNKHVLAFMNEVFTEDAFLGDDREEQIKKYLYSLSTRVRDMAFKLRNPSSHTGVMPFWKALYCANMVIMVDRILFDFVSKLKPGYVANIKSDN